jgi:hypothetical protein
MIEASVGMGRMVTKSIMTTFAQLQTSVMTRVNLDSHRTTATELKISREEKKF